MKTTKEAIDEQREIFAMMVSLWVILLAFVIWLAISGGDARAYVLPRAITVLLLSGYFTFFFDFDKHATLAVAEMQAKKLAKLQMEANGKK